MKFRFLRKMNGERSDCALPLLLILIYTPLYLKCKNASSKSHWLLRRIVNKLHTRKYFFSLDIIYDTVRDITLPRKVLCDSKAHYARFISSSLEISNRRWNHRSALPLLNVALCILLLFHLTHLLFSFSFTLTLPFSSTRYPFSFSYLYTCTINLSLIFI